MLKKLTLAAMAAVSMSAFAEDPTNTPMWKEVEMQARDLNAGDQYYLLTWMDRLPSQHERLLVEALSNVNRSAWTIHGKMYVKHNVKDDDLRKTQVIEVPTWNDWTFTDDDYRPLRMVMERPKVERDINYVTALDVLQSGLDWTERGMMFELWQDAPERAKDVLVRYIINNAALADYPSWRWRSTTMSK